MIDLTNLRGVHLTVAEAADYIGITPGRLRQMARASEIAAVLVAPQLYLIPQKEADRIRDQKHNVGRPRVSKLAG